MSSLLMSLQASFLSQAVRRLHRQHRGEDGAFELSTLLTREAGKCRASGLGGGNFAFRRHARQGRGQSNSQSIFSSQVISQAAD